MTLNQMNPSAPLPTSTLKTVGIMAVVSVAVASAVVVKLLAQHYVIMYGVGLFAKYMLPKAIAYMLLPLLVLGVTTIIAAVKKKPVAYAALTDWVAWAVMTALSVSADLS